MPVPSKSIPPLLRLLMLIIGFTVIVIDLLLDRISGSSEAGFGAVQILILLMGIGLILASILTERRLAFTQRLARNAVAIIQRYAPVLYTACRRYWLFELTAFSLIAYIYLFNPVTRLYPLGYAGLFQLEIDLIKNGGFSLPQSIPFYGPGGIPAAYPFLALYLGAALQHFFNISALDYLRFAPAVLTLSAAVALYFFIRRVTGSRGKAVIAASLTFLTYEIYIVHATAAGVVRGAALLFMLLALIFLHKVVCGKSTSVWDQFFAGLFIAMTVMTHLSYVVFLVLTAGLLWLSTLKRQWKTTTWRLAVIGGLGFVLSSPWWGTLISRYGLSTLTNASNSHGTLVMISRLLSGDLNYVIDNLFSSWGEIALIGFSLLAVVMALISRRFFLFFWFIATFLFVSDRRFLILVGAALSADMIHDVLTSTRAANKTRWGAVFACALILGFIWVRFLHTVKNVQPTITENLVNAADWIQENSAPTDKFLFLIKDHDTAEWMPYLTQLEPAIGHWGSEWLGNYPYRYDQWNQLSVCAGLNSEVCLDKFITENNLAFQFLISPQSIEGVNDPFQDADSYSRVYANDGYVVLQHHPVDQ